ncbi:F234B protein, partial [Atractosteus spatula]|nr:F234B protein [Atractosteus spatula]
MKHEERLGHPSGGDYNPNQIAGRLSPPGIVELARALTGGGARHSPAPAPRLAEPHASPGGRRSDWRSRRLRPAPVASFNNRTRSRSGEFRRKRRARLKKVIRRPPPGPARAAQTPWNRAAPGAPPRPQGPLTVSRRAHELVQHGPHLGLSRHGGRSPASAEDDPTECVVRRALAPLSSPAGRPDGSCGAAACPDGRRVRSQAERFRPTELQRGLLRACAAVTGCHDSLAAPLVLLLSLCLHLANPPWARDSTERAHSRGLEEVLRWPRVTSGRRHAIRARRELPPPPLRARPWRGGGASGRGLASAPCRTAVTRHRKALPGSLVQNRNRRSPKLLALPRVISGDDLLSLTSHALLTAPRSEGCCVGRGLEPHPGGAGGPQGLHGAGVGTARLALLGNVVFSCTQHGKAPFTSLRTREKDYTSQNAPLAPEAQKKNSIEVLRLETGGKKGSDLGEYDPLTQADSDESEEDDLVLNYTRNGLNRVSAEAAGGRDGEEEEEEEEWLRKGTGPRAKQTQDPAALRQFRAQRESEAGGPSSGSDPEGKRRAAGRSAARTTAFLVPLGCAVLVVLLCAFLIPCQQEALGVQHWERELELTADSNLPPLALWDVDNDTITDIIVGVTQLGNHSAEPQGKSKDSNLPPLALWDVDNDTITDIIVGVTQLGNHSAEPQGKSKVFSVLAVSGLDGGSLWSTAFPEALVSVQCGLGWAAPGGQVRRSMCLLMGSTHLTAVSSNTGSMLWSVSPGKIVSPAVSLADLTGDSVPDLLIATLPADQVSDLSLLLLSGASGTPIGHPVTFNLTTAEGQLIGPELHVTRLGAQYILFGLGTVEAASLKDIYMQANGRHSLPSFLRLKDPSWEKLRTANSSTLIHISRATVQVKFLLPLVVGTVNCSDWVLAGNRGVSVLGGADARSVWTLATPPLQSQPVPGLFSNDSTPDLLLQSLAHGVQKVQVIDGASGRSLWEAEFSSHFPGVRGSAVLTSTGRSAFLFWAGDPRPSSNVTKATAPPGPQGSAVFQRLYLLHPAYPTVLLQIAETTDTLWTAAVVHLEQQKDVFYLTVARRPAGGERPGAQVLRSLGLRGAVSQGRPVWLGEGSLRPGAFAVSKFFRQTTFLQHQVRVSAAPKGQSEGTSLSPRTGRGADL